MQKYNKASRAVVVRRGSLCFYLSDEGVPNTQTVPAAAPCRKLLICVVRRTKIWATIKGKIKGFQNAFNGPGDSELLWDSWAELNGNGELIPLTNSETQAQQTLFFPISTKKRLRLFEHINQTRYMM